MTTKGKIKVDMTRHLCSTCSSKLKCEFNFEGISVGDNQNVFKCKKYKKINNNKLKERVGLGNTFYHYVYVDNNNPKMGFKPQQRIETENRIDNLLHEVGNYFYSIDECNSEIERLSKM